MKLGYQLLLAFGIILFLTAIEVAIDVLIKPDKSVLNTILLIFAPIKILSAIWGGVIMIRIVIKQINK